MRMLTLPSCEVLTPPYINSRFPLPLCLSLSLSVRLCVCVCPCACLCVIIYWVGTGTYPLFATTLDQLREVQGGLDLSSYMVMPVQRLPRYR